MNKKFIKVTTIPKQSVFIAGFGLKEQKFSIFVRIDKIISFRAMHTTNGKILYLVKLDKDFSFKTGRIRKSDYERLKKL